jgi:hypothetical protein
MDLRGKQYNESSSRANKKDKKKERCNRKGTVSDKMREQEHNFINLLTAWEKMQAIEGIIPYF